MASISKAAVSQSEERLMLAIGEAIRLHTMLSPMTHDAIVGVLAFTTGAAIGRGARSRNDRRQIREVAIANLDNGLSAVVSEMANTRLILPEGMQ